AAQRVADEVHRTVLFHDRRQESAIVQDQVENIGEVGEPARLAEAGMFRRVNVPRFGKTVEEAGSTWMLLEAVEVNQRRAGAAVVDAQRRIAERVGARLDKRFHHAALCTGLAFRTASGVQRSS